MSKWSLCSSGKTCGHTGFSVPETILRLTLSEPGQYYENCRSYTGDDIIPDPIPQKVASGCPAGARGCCLSTTLYAASDVQDDIHSFADWSCSARNFPDSSGGLRCNRQWGGGPTTGSAWTYSEPLKLWPMSSTCPSGTPGLWPSGLCPDVTRIPNIPEAAHGVWGPLVQLLPRYIRLSKQPQCTWNFI